MNIHFLGAHNLESQGSRFVSLLIDNILALDAGGLTADLPLSEQLRLKAVLLTHHHYDHIRDIPALAMNLFLQDATIDIYSTQAVGDALDSYLLNGQLYPRFQEVPEERPTVRFRAIEPLKSENIEGYNILAVPVKHSVATVGYQITAPDGKTIFYTGDTGAGLATVWELVSPELLVVEVTSPNKYSEWAANAGHLTPCLLEQELMSFQKLKGYLPQVVTVHMNPMLIEEISAEIASVAKVLGASVTPAAEGMQIRL
ncbi:MAG TPA: MBL fold metallo-hydrolase [Dehalococcoidia bacterium]|nr:MBL fold metallo-hydrolase [Dehalococcoidia bacterium]